MRYSVLGGAVQISVPVRRRPLDSRLWMARAASMCVSATARWARRSVGRQTILLAMAGALALGAGAAARETRQRAVRPAVHTAAAAAVAVVQQGNAAPALTGVTEASPVDGLGLAPAAAENTLGALANPGYQLTDSVAAALDGVRLTVADATTMRQLQAQIAAPAPPAGLSGAALSDLVALVRQAQVASPISTPMSTPVAAPSPSTLDPVDLAQYQTAVRVAQQQVANATRTRDAAQAGSLSVAGLATPVVSAVATPPLAAGAVTTAAAAPASGTPANPALIADAQSRLAAAQSVLRSLLTVPSQSAVAAAQKAIQDALASTPSAPTDAQMTAANASVAQAQAAFDLASQGPSAAVVAQARASAEGRATPAISGAAHTPSVAAPVSAARPGENPEDTLSRLVHAPAAQSVAELKTNLDQAKAALAALQQQAAYAADPESQQAVIDARENLAVLIAPPDPQAVSDAQAVVAATQQQLDALQGRPESAVVSTVAATPTAVAQPAVVAATAVASPTLAGTVAAGSDPSDPVAVAENHLADAQKQLQTFVAASANVVPAALPQGSTAASANAVPTALPQGSTTTALTPGVLAAQNSLATGIGVSKNDITAVEVELRARYVTDALLESAQLHPSALSMPLSGLQTAATGASRSLLWPVVGPITQPFGVPELGVGAPHTGVDIGVPVGTPVLAAASGVVTFAGGDPSSGYGYYAIIDNGDGVSTLYGHLALPPLLHAGLFLTQGGLIGLSGSTGFSTGPHLHFEVRLNGTPVDPLKILPASGAH